MLGTGYVVVLLEQLGAATVVGQEQKERVVVLAKLAQPVHDTAHALVNAVNLRGIDSHSQVFPVLMAHIVPVWGVLITGAYLPLLVQQSHAFLGLVARGALGVPALAERALVLGDVLFQRVQGPVWCGI